MFIGVEGAGILGRVYGRVSFSVLEGLRYGDVRLGRGGYMKAKEENFSLLATRSTLNDSILIYLASFNCRKTRCESIRKIEERSIDMKQFSSIFWLK